jgi:hypothetical protein
MAQVVGERQWHQQHGQHGLIQRVLEMLLRHQHHHHQTYTVTGYH